jgi:uncharacterized membrane protein
MALAYPVNMLWVKTNGFHPDGGLTLDGNAGIAKYSPSEKKALDWLSQAPIGALVEAVGGEYTSFARISTNSGQPAVLGWPGHESQWGRTGAQTGSRQDDIALLYQTSNWEDARRIIQKYDIRYVYVGDLENSSYRVNRNKFDQYLIPVFQDDQVTVYEVPELIWDASAAAQQ